MGGNSQFAGKKQTRQKIVVSEGCHRWQTAFAQFKEESAAGSDNSFALVVVVSERHGIDLGNVDTSAY